MISGLAADIMEIGDLRQRVQELERKLEAVRQQLEFIARLTTDGQIFAAASAAKVALREIEK